jgi:hypothetical protein
MAAPIPVKSEFLLLFVKNIIDREETNAWDW